MDDVVRQLHGLPAEDIAAVHAAFRKINGHAYEEFLEMCEEVGIVFEEHTGSIHNNSEIDEKDESGAHQISHEQVVEFEDMNVIDQPGIHPVYFEERKYSSELLEEMEAKALAFDRRWLFKTALNAWRDRVTHIRAMERKADLWRDRRIASKALSHIQVNSRMFMAKMAELERREAAFVEWTDKRAAAKMMTKWVMEHRARSFENWKNRRAGIKMLETWRQKAAQSQASKTAAANFHVYILKRDTFQLWRLKTSKRVAERKFNGQVETLKTNIFARKWLTHWKVIVERRVTLRRFETLMERYYMFVAWRDEKLGRRVLVTWYQKAMAIKEMEKQADALWKAKQDARAREIGHNAVVTMYTHAMQTKENENIADEHYDQKVLSKYLDPDGPLRGKVRQIKEMEAKADEYREIKDQEYAAGVLRDWRQQAFITKRREEDADAFYDKWTKKRGLTFLQKWRAQAAERRGGREAAERVQAPITPAARRTAFMAESTALPIRLARPEPAENETTNTMRPIRAEENEV